jgi:hypothetical protein
LRSAGVVALLWLAAVPARAQQLTATEISAGVLGAVSSRDFWGAAVGLGRRLDNQSRVTGVVAVGALATDPAVRLEVAAQLIVNPSGRGGAGLYAGAGLAWQGAVGVHGGGYITALLGLESAPGARRGWFAEVGLGGGVRLALGLRWRRFPPWWR